MKIHEYQGKEILRRFGVPVPRGLRAFSAQEAMEAAQKLGGSAWMVKTQIHAGGRGAAGGVRLAHTPQQVHEAAEQLLGAPLVTSETGAAGQPVRRLLIEEHVHVRQEFALELRVSRRAQCVTFAARPAEAADDGAAPVLVDLLAGLTPAQCRQLCQSAGVPAEAAAAFERICRALYACYLESDALRLHVAPLALDEAGRLLALDVRFEFDVNALFRHPEIAALRDLDEERPGEMEAGNYDLSYLPLDGDIACMANGAGLALATMDAIARCGGCPANFLDLGAHVTVEKVTEALRIALAAPQVRGVLVNVLGGMERCDSIAEALVVAWRALRPRVPLVVRVKGRMQRRARELLRDATPAITVVETLHDAAHRIVAAAAAQD